jgi:hypothetical protein
MGNRRRRWRKMVQFEYDYADCRRQALIFGVVRPFHCGKFQVFPVLPDGCSSRRDQSTARAPPWPTCGPLWRASSAPTSTRRSSSRTCRNPQKGARSQQGADRQWRCGSRVQITAAMMFLSPATCPGSCVRVLAAGTARTNGASGAGHQAASVAVTAAGRSGWARTCRGRGAG